MSRVWTFLIDLNQAERRKWRRYGGRLPLVLQLLTAVLTLLFWLFLAIPLVPPTLYLGWLVAGQRGLAIVALFCLGIVALFVFSFVRRLLSRRQSALRGKDYEAPWFSQVDVTPEYVQIFAESSWSRMSWTLASKIFVADDHLAWQHGGVIIFVPQSQWKSPEERDSLIQDLNAWHGDEDEDDDRVRSIPSVYESQHESWPATSLLNPPQVEQPEDQESDEKELKTKEPDKEVILADEDGTNAVKPVEARPSSLIVIVIVSIALLGVSLLFNRSGLQPIWLRGLLITSVIIWYRLLPFVYRKMTFFLPSAESAKKAAKERELLCRFFAGPDGIVQRYLHGDTLIHETLYSRRDIASIKMTPAAIFFLCGHRHFRIPVDALDDVDEWHAQLAAYDIPQEPVPG